MTAAENQHQSTSTGERLRGSYFTPRSLVESMLDRVDWSEGPVVLDPACGDGSFLCAAARRLAQWVRQSDDREADPVRYCLDRLAGFEIHPESAAGCRSAVAAALSSALEMAVDPTRVQVGVVDVLEAGSLEAALHVCGFDPPHAFPRAIVGNPPYVESKRLPASQRKALKERFPTATDGAEDLYLYFLHVGLEALRPGDRLAFVLPNKLLVNHNAAMIRRRLLDDGLLEAIWLATQARLFADVAVYPIVLFASPDPGRTHTEVRRLRSELLDALEFHEPALIPPAEYAQTATRAFFLPPESESLRGLLSRMLGPGGGERLESVLDIRWSISFHRAGLRERFVTSHGPTTLSSRRFLGGGAFAGNGEVRRFGIEWGGWWIDYDEELLRTLKNPLPDELMFRRPKIVICQNSRTLRAAYDSSGLVLKDTFLCGLPKEFDHPLSRCPRALVGILCSSLIHFFYSHVFFGGHVNGGYLHFLQNFLYEVPLGRWDAESAGELERLVIARELAPASEHAALEDEIEHHVATAFEVSSEEHAEVRNWCALDSNWPLRDRVRRFRG